MKNDRTENEAWHLSLKYLSSRSRTKWEIISYLSQKNFDHDTIENVINQLEQANLLDDAYFVYNYVQEKTVNASKPWGPAKLRHDLMQKGIAREIIDEALSWLTVEEEQALARKLLERENPEFKTFSREKQQKLAAYLRRRGFSIEVIMDIFEFDQE